MSNCQLCSKPDDGTVGPYLVNNRTYELCVACGRRLGGSTLRSELEVVEAPVLPPLVPTRQAVVPSVYQSGRYGVTATVQIPQGDVEIMNNLGKLVGLLHEMAARCNGFVGMTEHTRKMIRDMRILATDVQEEIEMRTGPS